MHIWILLGCLYHGAVSDTQVVKKMPYTVQPAVSLSLSLAGLVTYGLVEGFVAPNLHTSGRCAYSNTGTYCDPSALPSFEKNIPYKHSKPWKTASDVLSYGSVALPLTALLAEHLFSDSSSSQKWADYLLLLEAVAASSVLTSVLKYTFQRPRPSAYNTSSHFNDMGEHLSFPSGHTSLAASATTAYTVMYAFRHPRSWWIYPVAATALGLTALTGYARVEAGRHFYTDVIAGALLGGAVGVAIPWLHKNNIQPSFNLTHQSLGMQVMRTF